ncbi:MAG: hypothetical protein GVY30_06945 [Chloroflexi bacterium]|jgi:hypothetical protein|nr:hypothetical protein [Chloroflexota bacterium]
MGNSKGIKRQLREWRMEAHERELKRELEKLDQSFEAWRQGEISSGELSVRVHQYDRGPLKDLYSRYNYGEDKMNVAYAIVVGILDEEEVSEELLEALSGAIQVFQSMKENGELKLLE